MSEQQQTHGNAGEAISGVAAIVAGIMAAIGAGAGAYGFALPVAIGGGVLAFAGIMLVMTSRQ